MAIRMMVFDMAGTTVADEDDAVAGRLCEALAAGGARATSADVDPVMGIPKPLAIAHLLRQAWGREATKAEIDAIHKDFQRRIVHHYATAPHIREMPGATDLFDALRTRGIRITLDTGFDRPTANAIIQRLGWESILDDTVTSDEVAHGRPGPDMIHVLMARAGITDPSEVGKIGDSISDLEQGIAAGCGFTAAIGERTRPHMQAYPSVRRVERLSDLLPLIDAMEPEGAFL